MDDVLYAAHVIAGARYGQATTCGSNIDYGSESSASRAAAMKTHEGAEVLEGYPCAFCRGWHIGRKMSEDELAESVLLAEWFQARHSDVFTWLAGGNDQGEVPELG